MGFPGRAILNTSESPFCMITGNPEDMHSWQITATPLKGGHGQFSSTLYLFRDVTEIDRSVTQADLSLKAAQHARESISRNLSV